MSKKYTRERIIGYLDGFEAAVESVESFKMHTTFGPNATLDDAQRFALESVKEVMRGQIEKLRKMYPDVPKELGQ